jgi:acyl-ACP thioesterase
MQFYEQTQKIQSSMVGPQLRLCLSQLPVLIQDVSTEHAERMGVDGPTLREKSNAYWAITKTKIVVSRLPRMFEQTTIQTWPNQPSAISCDRNCTIVSDGNICVQARTQWVMLDCDTHKLRRLDSTCYPRQLDYLDQCAAKGPYRRVTAAFEETDFVYDHLLRASDIDLSNHTNNAVSCRLLLDMLTQNELSALEACEMNIHYLHESHEGETLRFFRKETPEGMSLMACKQDGTPTVTMLLTPLAHGQ